MDVALFDYGTGNLHSLAKALEHGGARVRIEADMARALEADAIVLPGVGAFGAAAAGLATVGGRAVPPVGRASGGLTLELPADPAAPSPHSPSDAGAAGAPGATGAAGAGSATPGTPAAHLLRGALDAGMPCLGICLGMQLLFEESEEGEGRGVGALRGRVRKVQARRVPHMGWNAVETAEDALFAGVDPLVAYYANSFVVDADDPEDVIAWTSYGADRFPAAVRKGSVVGVQFHPEKSGAAGLRLVANFLREAGR